jgi:hypothetical protein
MGDAGVCLPRPRSICPGGLKAPLRLLAAQRAARAPAPLLSKLDSLLQVYTIVGPGHRCCQCGIVGKPEIAAELKDCCHVIPQPLAPFRPSLKT